MIEYSNEIPKMTHTYTHARTQHARIDTLSARQKMILNLSQNTFAVIYTKNGIFVDHWGRFKIQYNSRVLAGLKLVAKGAVF